MVLEKLVLGKEGAAEHDEHEGQAGSKEIHDKPVGLDDRVEGCKGKHTGEDAVCPDERLDHHLFGLGVRIAPGHDQIHDDADDGKDDNQGNKTVEAGGDHCGHGVSLVVCVTGIS